MNSKRDYIAEGRHVSGAELGSGKSIDEALEAIKKRKAGLGVVLRAMADVEGLELEAVARMIDRRGDFEEY